MTSLIASARRLTSHSLATRAGSTNSSWQDDAWDMFDLIGEQRYLATTLAGRMGQAKLYVGRVDSTNSDPIPVDDPQITAILDSVGATPAGRGQLITRLGVNLFVAGDGWLCGIPRHLMPPSLAPLSGVSTGGVDAGSGSGGGGGGGGGSDWLGGLSSGGLAIDDLEWRMLSVTEVSGGAGGVGGSIQLRLGQAPEETLDVDPDEVFLIRVWRPHPRRWWEADSPTRSSLPVLRELVGLTMDVSAQVDSRLAGAGLLLIPQSAQRALQMSAGLTEQDGQDVFTEALMDAMLTPIADRSSASALVPLCVTVPDESINMFRHVSFGRPLDEAALPLRDEAIRRLALGEDAPPELLLGSGGLSHWGAWLVQEDVVSTHLEPPLSLICDALTSQYLWPVLMDQGMSEEEARSYVVWYDVSHLAVRPNRSAEAQVLHSRGVISDTAFRSATGFEDSDAPAILPEVRMALDAAKASPGLLASPGLAVLVEQFGAALRGEPIPPVEAAIASSAAGDVAGASGTGAGEGGSLPGMDASIGADAGGGFGAPSGVGSPSGADGLLAASGA